MPGCNTSNNIEAKNLDTMIAMTNNTHKHGGLHNCYNNTTIMSASALCLYYIYKQILKIINQIKCTNQREYEGIIEWHRVRVCVSRVCIYLCILCKTCTHLSSMQIDFIAPVYTDESKSH